MGVNSKAVADIVGDFRQGKWDSNPMERTLELVIPSPESAVELLRLALDEIPGGATFLDAAIAFMPEDAFPELVDIALDRFQADRGNRLAEGIVHHCSLQSVGALHPHLTRVFELAPNGSCYYASWPWRESGKQHFSYLRDVLENDPDGKRRFRAWEAMFETREPEVLQFALLQADRVGMAARREDYLLGVGFESRGSGLRRLDTDPVYHLLLPEDYLPAEQTARARWRDLIRQHHPTWRSAPGAGPRMRFGGQWPGTCACCGGGLHHLITLEPIPDTLGVAGLKRLVLATCLSCLGWEQPQLFYKHDEAGAPRQAGFAGVQAVPEFPAGALKPAEVQIAQISRRWKWQDHGSSNHRENLHRVGGVPCWIQYAEYPACPECGNRMVFLLQVTSDLRTGDGAEWMWGDCGICYTFWCDRCSVSGHLWQCY